MHFVQSFCVLDRDQKILYVGGDWDAFAEANDARSATGAQIAGTLIFDHIEGFETRAFLNAALYAVCDSRKPFVLDYRCDGPSVRRFMRMTISALKGGRTLIVHDFLHEEPVGRTLVPWLLVAGARTGKCSVCCAVQFGEVWMDPFVARQPHPVAVRPDLCPECRMRTSVQIDEMDRTRDTVTTNVIRLPKRA